MQPSPDTFLPLVNSTYNNQTLLGVQIKNVIAEAQAPFSSEEFFGPKGWEIQKEISPGDGPGRWRIDSDGVLNGSKKSDGPTILWFSQAVEGDHMLEFQASTVFPNTHDINSLWNGNGQWSEYDPSTATVGSIAGWSPKIYWGIESRDGSTSYNQNGSLTAGRPYNVAVGQLTVGSAEQPITLDYMFVNGRLITEIESPPGGFPGVEPRFRSQVAFSTWQSKINVFGYRISQTEPVWQT